MTREQLLTKYKIIRHTQRSGTVYFSVRKQCWILWWYTAFERLQAGLTDTYKQSLHWSTYKAALKWVNEDVDHRMSIYDSKVLTIDKYEP